MFLACIIFLLDSSDYWITNQLRWVDKSLISASSLNIQNGTVIHTCRYYSLHIYFIAQTIVLGIRKLVQLRTWWGCYCLRIHFIFVLAPNNRYSDCKILKGMQITGHFLYWTGYIFEEVHYVNISSINFLFELDNGLTCNIWIGCS